jgi:hypothetical protein
MHIQIDVVKIDANTVACNMYTGNRCIKIFMLLHDYNELVRDGFFIRDGKEADSAGVRNTTDVFIPETKPEQATEEVLEGCGALAD